MSETNEVTRETDAETSLTTDAVNLGRYYLWRAFSWARPLLGSRRGLIFLAIALLGVGAALNWSWLVAIGVAPILVALAPCAVMCAVGLCAMRGGKSCSSGDQSAKGGSETAASAKPRDDA